MDEDYAEYDSMTAFYGMDYSTEYRSYSSYYNVYWENHPLGQAQY